MRRPSFASRSDLSRADSAGPSRKATALAQEQLGNLWVAVLKRIPSGCQCSMEADVAPELLAASYNGEFETHLGRQGSFGLREFRL